MPAGRPSKLDEALLKRAEKYLTEYPKLGQPIPSVAGLAVYLKISRETVHAWAGEGRDEPPKSDLHARFSDIYSDLMSGQELELLKGGITGDFNAAITKMVLTRHGYSDKVEQHNTGTQTHKHTGIITFEAASLDED